MIEADGAAPARAAQQMMLDGSAEEMPPKDEFTSYLDVSAAEGGLIGAAQACVALGVSRQAVMNLIERGKLRSWHFFGHPMVSAAEIRARQTSGPGRPGRPRKLMAA